jgi:cobalt/nickel transport system permease protein
MLASRLLDRHSDLTSPLHRLDARVKLVCAAVLIVAVLAVPVKHNWRLALLAAPLLVAAIVSRLPASWLVRRMLVLLPFLLIAALLLPLAPAQGPEDALTLPQLGLVLSRLAVSAYVSISAKCLLALFAATLLVGSTRTVDLLRAGQALGLPRTITALMGFAATYLMVLSDEAARMLTARDSRGKVRGLWRNLKVAGAMLRALMVRTFERGERIALAMVSRGYRGRMPELSRKSLPLGHVLAGLAFVTLIALLYALPVIR